MHTCEVDRVKITIQHNSDGWVQIFKSPEMQALVDETGQRIAEEAGGHFGYTPGTNNIYTAGGFVSSDEYTGAYLEATLKVLTKAVHA